MLHKILSYLTCTGISYYRPGPTVGIFRFAATDLTADSIFNRCLQKLVTEEKPENILVFTTSVLLSLSDITSTEALGGGAVPVIS
jgi:hypothetical protein